MIEGNNAKKNLKAKDDALVVKEFFWIPSIKKLSTSYRERPSNPGSTSFLENIIGILISGLLVIFSMIFFKGLYSF